MANAPKLYYVISKAPEGHEGDMERFHTLAVEAGLTAEQETAILKRGYMTTPASFRFHSNFVGGLFFHSECVVKRLKELVNLYFTSDSDKAFIKANFNATKVGLLHDFCKAVYSTQTQRGEWTYKPCSLPGHAEASLMALQAIGITFTPYELLAIRWHMGAFGLEQKELDNYSLGIADSKNLALLTHHADMIATRFDEKEYSFSTRKEWDN